MNQDTYLTRDGLKKIREELDHLKTVRRKEIAWRIQEAKELGDLSENAEYTEAKNEQAFVEGRIAELEVILKNATVIDESTKRDSVSIGSTFSVETEHGEKMTYNIVGSNEVDPGNGKISNVSPLGQAFLGHKVGDTVVITIPRGSTQAKIVSIN